MKTVFLTQAQFAYLQQLLADEMLNFAFLMDDPDDQPPRFAYPLQKYRRERKLCAQLVNKLNEST